MEDHAENVYQRLFLDPHLTLVNKPKKPLHARYSFEIRYFERGLSKIIPVLFVPLNLESVERKGKIQKCEYLEKEKSFLNEIKNLFHSF